MKLMTNKFKNILYIHRTQGGGVEAVHITGISDAFKFLGSKVDVFSPAGLRIDNLEIGLKRNIVSRPAKFSYLSKYLPEFLFECIEIAYNIVALVKLSRCDLDKYDLIFERYAIFSVIGVILSRRKKIPLVLEVNYTSRSPLVRQRSRLLKPFATRVDKLVFNSATVLTPVSSTLVKQLVEDFGVESKKIIMLPNAVDPAKFSRTKEYLSVDNGKKIIGFVGGFYPWHGLDLLIDAFKLIHEKVPEAQIVLVGDGPELNNIKQKVHDEQLVGKVFFTGRLGHEHLPEVMNSFYVGVMPDSNDYGSPMKIFEYMALSIPVIAPDYPPILDVMETGKEGIVFNRGDVRSLSDALAKILTDTSLAKSLAKNARRSIEERFNWVGNVKKILDSF